MVVQRSLAQLFLALQAALTASLTVLLVVQQDSRAWAAAAGAVIYGVCWQAFRRGWEPARQVAVGLLTVLMAASTRQTHLTAGAALAVMIPPVVALMLTSEAWIVGAAVAGLLGLSLRSGFRAPLWDPLVLSLLAMAVSGLVLARRAMNAAVRRSAAQAESADKARHLAETAAREAIAERDRATKLEAQVLHMQRLESVGRLAGGVAHDFNNLLTVIGASASMAERSIEQGQPATSDLEELQLAVGRAAELTQRLLAFARRQILRKQSVDLNELVSNVERLLRRVLEESVELAIELHPRPLTVQADPAQLEQVIVNLIINARDAVGRGGRIVLATGRQALIGHAALELAVPTGTDYACVEVRDDGVGMGPDVKARLFEPFFTTKPPGKGNGLGLATSFGIVRQHEGMIEVESTLGVGSTLRVLLPLAAPVAAATSGVVPVAERRPRVLVVEDEPQIRAIAARALTSAGFEVSQAANGALGLAHFKGEQPPPDVLVTDVVMPEMGGPELARAARELAPHVGLVFMSGYPDAMQDMRAEDFPGAAFLCKPFSPQLLVAAVRERLPSASGLGPEGLGSQAVELLGRER